MAVDLDVTSLHHRHATHRWERTSVGDLLERMTWSFPDKEAIVGREGAYGDGAFRRQADQIANQVAHGLLARGLERGDVVMLFGENSIEGYLVKIAADLIAYCRAALAGYETPKSVVFADSLPETVGGKVLKDRLRASYADHYAGAEVAP